MALDKIEYLLEKYFDAKTTIKEENRLRQFFKQDEVPVHLAEFKALFNYFDNTKSEKFNKNIAIKSKKINLKWFSVAASVAVLITFYILNTNKQEKIASQQEVKQEFKMTQDALNLISKNLKEGNLAVAQLKEFEITKNEIFK